MKTIRHSEASQLKGFVTVLFSHGASIQDIVQNFQWQRDHYWLANATPFRTSAVHFCIHSELLGNLFSSAMKYGTPDFRIRTRIFYGSALECLYELNSFGMAMQIMPIDGLGNVRYDYVAACLSSMQHTDDKLEEIDRKTQGERIVEINENDILLGKGPNFQWYPGNVTLMKIVEELQPKHNTAAFHDKKLVAIDAITRVKQSGGRFLERDKNDHGHWVEVSDAKTHKKVAMGFRNMKKKLKRLEKPIEKV